MTFKRQDGTDCEGCGGLQVASVVAELGMPGHVGCPPAQQFRFPAAQIEDAAEGPVGDTGADESGRGDVGHPAGIGIGRRLLIAVSGPCRWCGYSKGVGSDSCIIDSSYEERRREPLPFECS